MADAAGRSRFPARTLKRSRSALVRWRYALALAVALALLGLVAWQVTVNVERFRADYDAVAGTYEVTRLLRSVHAETRDAESAQRGLLLTGNRSFERDFHESEARARLLADELQQRLADRPQQLVQARELGQIIDQRLDFAYEIIQRYDRDGLESAREEVGKAEGSITMGEFAALVDTMAEIEQALLAQRRAASETGLNDLLQVALGGLALAVVLLLALFVTLLAENRQRARAEARAERVGDELRTSVDQLHQLASDIRALNHYAGMLQSCDSVVEAVEQTRAIFERLLPDCGVAVFLLRASADYLEQVAAWGPGSVRGSELFAPRDCWALRRAQIHAVDAREPTSSCAHLAAATTKETTSTLCAPLVAQGEILGLVVVAGARAANTEVEELVQPLTEQMSLALANLRLRETLRLQSIRDPLTGLFNRRYLEESLTRELARCGRRSLPLAVIMLDVDHFKAFNDGQGHDAGDVLLQKIAAVLRGACRGEDIACRYGGEEFTLILPEMDAAGARARGEDVRERIAALQVSHLGRELPQVTASLGLAVFPANGAHGTDLLRLADAALYRAKAAGRNRLESA